MGRPLNGSAWKWMLGLGVPVVALYFIQQGIVAKDITYLAIGSLTAGGIVVGVRLHRPAAAAGWYLVAAGSACFVGGDAVLNFYDIVLDTSPPYPSIADLVYLAGYPLLFAGVLRISRSSAAVSAWHGWTDAAAVSVGTLGLLWHFLMGPTLTGPLASAEGGTLGKLVTMAYPLMDLAVIWVVSSAVLRGAAGRSSDRLLLAAMVSMLVSDFWFDLQLLHGTYDAQSPVNAGYLLSYLLVAAAALHPSVADHPSHSTDLNRMGRRWVPLVAGAALISPVLILVSGLSHLPIDLPVLSTTSLVVFGLISLRVFRLFTRVTRQNALLEDSTASLRRALSAQQSLEDDLRYQTLHDGLTGLPNRWLLQERVGQALSGSRGQRVALCCCDLDDFKAVNDRLGQEVGDEVLRTVAKRLTALVRGGATVARLGSDEFAVLLEDSDQPAAAKALAERIGAVLREPVTVREHEIRLSVGVGVAVAAAGATTQLLLSEADSAMYEAKSAGKDQVVVFESSMRSKWVEKATLVNCFPGSLERSEFVLEYQPQFSLREQRLEGFECLVRWRHPSLGLIGPGRFIPLAEETRFILPLGRWVLLAACQEAARWPAVDGSPLTVAVNLSGWQVAATGFLSTVREALLTSGLAPHQLILEITESVLMDNPAGIAVVLGDVRRMGVRVAIDDFGTGFSSLSTLRQLPVDILKIDKSFIDPLEDPDNEGDAFVAAIVRLATDLQLSTVAEGIEHRSQLDALARLGCDSAQGYLVSASLSATDARRLLEDGASRMPVPATIPPVRAERARRTGSRTAAGNAPAGRRT